MEIVFCTLHSCGFVLPACLAGDRLQGCDQCEGTHWLRKSDRSPLAARQCDECGVRHAVKHNEMWLESAKAGGPLCVVACSAVQSHASVQLICTHPTCSLAAADCAFLCPVLSLFRPVWHVSHHAHVHLPGWRCVRDEVSRTRGCLATSCACTLCIKRPCPLHQTAARARRAPAFSVPSPKWHARAPSR